MWCSSTRHVTLRRIVTSHHTPVEGRENTEPVWSPSATRFSAPTSHYYHRRRQVSSGLGIFRLSAARKFDPTRNRTPASWMANERHTTTLTHVFNVPPERSIRFFAFAFCELHSEQVTKQSRDHPLLHQNDKTPNATPARGMVNPPITREILRLAF